MNTGRIIFTVNQREGKIELSIIWVQPGKNLEGLLCKTLCLKKVNKFRKAMLHPGLVNQLPAVVFDTSANQFMSIAPAEDYMAEICWDETKRGIYLQIVSVALREDYRRAYARLRGVLENSNRRRDNRPLAEPTLHLCHDDEL